MSGRVNEIDWTSDQLWRGSILAAIAHAIMVAHYPELSNEHSWDGINYSVQDSGGIRGTLTFGRDYVVAAFRNDNSVRYSESGYKPALHFFNGAPSEVIEIASVETLQYLLENTNGIVSPQITTAFWSTSHRTYSLDATDELYDNGASLLEYQLMGIEEAMECWQEYYDMSEKQCALLRSIYKRKVIRPFDILHLTKAEINSIGDVEQEGLHESKVSFKELGIEW